MGRLDDGTPYYTMKLIKGSTLAGLLADRPDPGHDLSRFVSAFGQVGQALAYAHARGVVHRDLKPLNVMVGAFGEVQVMDWGLAKVLGRPPEATPSARPTSMIRTVRTDSDAGASQPGSLMGTLAYMPPEQALGMLDLVDERADVFALGSMLCEILTGGPAYVARTSDLLFLKSAGADLADALARLDASGADAELIALARHCLAPDREARPRDAGEVASSVSAYQATVQERLRAAEIAQVEAVAKAAHERKQRRMRIALAAAFVALIALGTGGWASVNRLHASARASTALVVDSALRNAGSWRDRAKSDPPGDLSAWTEALASARRADRLLGDEAMGTALRRRVAETLGAIEEGRDGARADVPGCVASMKRLRNRDDLPPTEIVPRPDRGRSLASWPTPDYSGFTILRSSAYLDLSRWRAIPEGTTPAEAGRVEPALLTRVVDLIRKKNVSHDNSHIRFRIRTKAPEADFRCPGHGYKVRGSATTEDLGDGVMPSFVWEVEVDLSGVPVGAEARVVLHATLWNEHQHDAGHKARIGVLSPDALSEDELAVRFPPGRKPALPPSLFVFPEGSARKGVPADARDFLNPIDQDWWSWRPRDVLKDFVYQIEWEWPPDRAG